MNGQKIVEWFFSFSEKVIAYVINIFFVILLALPLVLVDLTFSEDMLKVPLIFIPLASLYLLALKSLIYAGYMVFVKKKDYYGLFFIEALKDRPLISYLYYLVSVGLLYIGLNSTYILITSISQWFWMLFLMIILLVVPNILYTSLQFALYEKTSIKNILTNSVVLTFMYGLISIILAVFFAFLVYRFQFNPFLVVTIGIPVLTAILIYVQTIIDRNQKK